MMFPPEVLRAFSNDRSHSCVDCGEPAHRYLEYTMYEVGDLVCVDHVAHRRKALGRKVSVHPIPQHIRVVPPERKATRGQ